MWQAEMAFEPVYFSLTLFHVPLKTGPIEWLIMICWWKVKSEIVVLPRALMAAMVVITIPAAMISTTRTISHLLENLTLRSGSKAEYRSWRQSRGEASFGCGQLQCYTFVKEMLMHLDRASSWITKLKAKSMQGDTQMNY